MVELKYEVASVKYLPFTAIAALLTQVTENSMCVGLS